MYVQCTLGISKKFSFGSDFLRRGFVSSDKYWAHPEHLKNLIECLVILRIPVDFQPSAHDRAASTKI